MYRFYQTSPIQDTVSLELSWTHYRTLLRVENAQARDWYFHDAINQSWST